MKLKEIIINNFMPYKGEQKVTFPQHETQNIMLLFGDNMRGKTSFLNAIRWVFFGVALARHLRTIPRTNLINIDAAADGDWSMSITIHFSHRGKSYELRRVIDKNNHISKPRKDADFVETIWLSIDGEKISGDLIVYHINQITPEEISRFFLFDGELLQEYENLLIEESEQGEKIKEHIEQALGVPALVHGREELFLLLKKARSIQAKEVKKSDEIIIFAEKQRLLEVTLDSLDKDLKELISQRDSVKIQLNDIEDELKHTDAVQRAKMKLDALSTKQKSIDKQLIELANEQRELLRDLWKDVLSSSVSPILEKLRVTRDTLQQSILNIAILESKLGELRKALNNNVCPTCKQNIHESEKDSISAQIQTLQAEAELSVVNMDDLTALNSKIDKLGTIQSSGEAKRIISVINKQRKLQIQLIGVETKLEELNKEIKGFDTNQIMRQREKRDHLAIQLLRLKKKIEELKHQIDENNKKQGHIAKIIAKSPSFQGQKSSIRVSVYHDLESIFSKGIDHLRDLLRKKVEEYASQAFYELTTEKTYSGLEINQNYGLSILDQAGRVLKERSAGAEQIVALSLIDALNRTARKSGPIVMDTPLGRLDPKHRSNVLRYLPKMAEQVVLLVHEGEIDPERDIPIFADRIGVRYQIKRISATKSRIIKSH